MESEQTSTRDVWLDYISKLNDRALNRQRASGVTTWAVVGVIAVLLTRVLAGLPTITANSTAALLHLTTVTVIIDLMLFVEFLSTFLLSLCGESGEVRLQSRLDRAAHPIAYVFISFALAALSAANIITSRVAPDSLSYWPFLVLGSFFLTNALAYPFTLVRAWIKHRKYFQDLPEFSSSLLGNSHSQRIAIYSAMIVILSLGLIPAVQSLPHISTSAHVNTLIWSFYVAGVIYLSMVFFYLMAKRRYDIFLTQLERRIVVEALPPNVIRSEFIREFLGEDVREWLTKAEEELKRLHDVYNQAASKAEEQFTELVKIDRGMHFEITGRKKAICETFMKALSGYFNYTEKLCAQIQHLLDQRASGAYSDLFKQLIRDWKRQFESIRNHREALCIACGKATGEQEKTEPCAPEVRPPERDAGTNLRISIDKL